MDAKDRVNACQDKLVAMGVRDVKFYFNSTPESLPSQVASDAADVLEAMLDKKYKTAELIGDSKGLKP